MAGNLSERLKRIRETGLLRPGSEVRPAGPKAPSPADRRRGGSIRQTAARRLREEGWTEIAPLLFERTLSRGLPFPDEIDAAPFLLPRISPAVASTAALASFASREGLSFIDTETTGLSTGAGTTAFAFGLGRFEGSDFTLTQLFLADFPGEADFLSRAKALFEGTEYIVSYNGKSFDVPLLRSRFIMNRMRFAESAHIDLLTTARRLWGRPAGGANLPKIESYALGREREFDVPGSEAPERYMRFLRTGEVEGILPVLDHHRSDILSLPSVMVAADKVFRGLKHRAEHDAVRLSLILKALGRPGWERGLRDAAAEGDAEAARILIKLLKKEGRWDEALESVEASPESIESLIEAARILERRKRDFSQALALSRRALDFSPKASEAEAIGKRIARLERRIGSR